MGQIRISPHLTFNGNTREAMEFYHQIFGGKLDMQTYGEADITSSEDYKDKILHAHLEADDIVMMAADQAPDMKITVGNNVSLILEGADADRLNKIFHDLAEDGEVVMPLDKQFWGDTFGMVDDRFDTHWMINISRT